MREWLSLVDLSHWYSFNEFGHGFLPPAFWLNQPSWICKIVFFWVPAGCAPLDPLVGSIQPFFHPAGTFPQLPAELPRGDFWNKRARGLSCSAEASGNASWWKSLPRCLCKVLIDSGAGNMYQFSQWHSGLIPSPSPCQPAPWLHLHLGALLPCESLECANQWPPSKEIWSAWWKVKVGEGFELSLRKVSRLSWPSNNLSFPLKGEARVQPVKIFWNWRIINMNCIVYDFQWTYCIECDIVDLQQCPVQLHFVPWSCNNVHN